MKNNKINFKSIFITIMAFLALCIFNQSANAFSFRNMTLDMIHISDTHIDTTRQDTPFKAIGSSSLLLKDAIKQINKIKGLDFVMFTGDMVDTAKVENYERYYNLLKRLEYPSLNAFGNHDFQGDLTKEEVLSIVRENNQNYIFDNTYYAFTPKTDYRIIVLDGTINDKKTSNGEISKEQMAFLKQELDENQDKIVVIALHFPPVQPFVAIDHKIINEGELNELLIKYKNPIVVLAGHYHATKINRIGNLVYITTPSLVTYPMAFRRIKITNFKDRVVFKIELIPTTLEDIKNKNKETVFSYSALEGGEFDKNINFIYMKRSHKSESYKRKKITKANEITISKDTKTKKIKTKKEKSENIKKEKVKKTKKSVAKKKQKEQNGVKKDKQE